MSTLKFKTTIKCGGCIANVTPFLNQEPGIINWNVDLASPERIMTVETEKLGHEEIIEVLRKAGYKAELLITA